MKTNLDMQNVLVLALYLTHFEKNDRNDKLLALALPFAYVQPFISEARIPPEMFIGRSAELAAIQDMAGPVFVYGGRQLGKSASCGRPVTWPTIRNRETMPFTSTSRTKMATLSLAIRATNSGGQAS